MGYRASLKHRFNSSGLVLGIATALVLTACAPVEVRQCAVRAVGADQVALGADVFNRTNKIAQRIFVLVRAAGLRSSNPPNANDGSFVQYALHGSFRPSRWVHVEALAPLSADSSTMDQRLGNVSRCEVHAVEFQDGTHWEGPSPL